MARTRFVPDTGLTVRMTAVMFLLGGLFVALVVALMYGAGAAAEDRCVAVRPNAALWACASAALTWECR